MKIQNTFKLNGYEQKRIYGNSFIGYVTKYLNCSITNLNTGKTINGITLKAPLNSFEQEQGLINLHNWEV